MSTEPCLPKLHNAMWPGLVGKGSPGAEPAIDLDTMLNLTAQAEVNGVRFDGVDLFLFDPHVSIDIDEDGIKRLAEKIQAKGFVVGSVVAPVWGPTGGGSAIGSQEDRNRFLQQVRKACRIARRLRELGARPYGVVRIDSACGVSEWAQAPAENQAKIIGTFTEACQVAEDFGERLAAEGEICWGGMHSWKRMLQLLEGVNRPQTLGFQADMAHTLLYTLGYNAPEDALLPSEWNWSDPALLDEALKKVTDALRPWTIDFHVAQNDGTVKGSGTHDKTGHHCAPDDSNGKLDVARHAGFWLRDQAGELTKGVRHICWDGCMFPNEVMLQPETWNKILRTMLAVRNAHGWNDTATGAIESPARTSVRRAKPHRRAAKRPKPAKRPAAKRSQAKTRKGRAKPRRSRAVPTRRGKRQSTGAAAHKARFRKPAKRRKQRSHSRGARRRSFRVINP